MVKRSNRMAPVLEELAANSGGRVILAKVNGDESPGLRTGTASGAIPTVLLFRGGEVLERITGAVPRAVLHKILDARA